MEDISNQEKNVNPVYYTKVVWKSGMTVIVCRHCSGEMIHGTQVDFPHKDFCFLRESEHVRNLKSSGQDSSTSFTGTEEATPAKSGGYPREIFRV